MSKNPTRFLTRHNQLLSYATLLFKKACRKIRHAKKISKNLDTLGFLSGCKFYRVVKYNTPIRISHCPFFVSSANLSLKSAKRADEDSRYPKERKAIREHTPPCNPGVSLGEFIRKLNGNLGYNSFSIFV